MFSGSGSHELYTFSVILSVAFQNSVALASSIRVVGVADASVVWPILRIELIVDVNVSNIVSVLFLYFMLEANFEEFYRSRMLYINIVSLNCTHSVGNYFIILM